MEQYQPHNSIDPSHPAPPFFPPSSSASAISEPPPVDNFTPIQPPLPNNTSYDEMIISAILALGEKDGSSRQAIAKYIDRVYSNLPSNHSILLTNNLKNMKISGQLDMVKHSYLLPSRSNPPHAQASYSFQPTEAAPPLYNTSAAASDSTYFAGGIAVPTNTSTSQPKKRGRPAKPKADVALPFSAQDLSTVAGPNQAQFHVNEPNGSGQNVFDEPNGPGQNIFNGLNESGQDIFDVPNGSGQNVFGGFNGACQNVFNGPNGSGQDVFDGFNGSGQNVFNSPIGSGQNVAGPILSTQNVFDGPVEATNKRRPGRPRKDKSSPAQYTLFAGQAQNASLPTGDAPAIQPTSGSEAMLVSLGLSDGPAGGPSKMRPRRSIKPTRTIEQPIGEIKPKKRPGRPRKVKPVGSTLAPGVYPVQVPVGLSPAPAPAPGAAPAPGSVSGRRRGRPRKYAVVPAAAPGGVVNGGQQPKKRGRKPKNMTQGGAFSVPVSFMLPEQMNGGGDVISPQGGYVEDGGGDGNADVVTGVVPVSGGFSGVPPYQFTGKRGRGRPPRMDRVTGMMKPRRLSGKPLGRPRKNPTGIVDQSFAIKNLKDKIDYVQTKIKEAIPLIKPCINVGEANAMEALGQLEELASADMSAPVNVQTEQQVAPQEVQAEVNISNNGY